jgi:type II secretory pathway pseudopilin PulG
MKMNKIKAALFHQSGRSMIEMLGVLAIIGVLSVGGLAGYNMAMQKIRINHLVSEFSLFVSEMSAMYIDMKYEHKTGAVQGADMTNLKKAAAALGATVNGPSYGSGDFDYWIYFSSNLSDDACTALASMQMDKGSAIGAGGFPWYELGSQGAVNFCLTRKKNQVVGFLFGATFNLSH